MNKQKIKGVLIPLTLLISILANVYWFGNKALNDERQKYYNAGASEISSQIVKSLKDNGNLVLNVDGKQITLTPND